MTRPAYRITVGSNVVDTTDEPKASTVVRLLVELDMDTPINACTVVLGNVGGLIPQRANDLSVALGYAGDADLSLVLKGQVAFVEPSLVTTRVTGLAGSVALATATANETFRGQTAGAIVRDLAGRAGVDVETVHEGTEFPAYVVDARRSVFQHMTDLATLCGFDLYLVPEGRLVFMPFAGGRTVHVLEHAKHIIELDLVQSPPAADTVEAWGEGPGAGRGENAWAWLTTDFSGSRGTSGSGTRTLLLERPALRTAHAARTAADAAATAIRRRTVRGRVVTFGRPEIKLGDAIRLASVPDSRANGVYQVRGVRHRLTKRRGFVTEVRFRGTG